jgi:hypothetical protein
MIKIKLLLIILALILYILTIPFLDKFSLNYL